MAFENYFFKILENCFGGFLALDIAYQQRITSSANKKCKNIKHRWKNKQALSVWLIGLVGSFSEFQLVKIIEQIYF